MPEPHIARHCHTVPVATLLLLESLAYLCIEAFRSIDCMSNFGSYLEVDRQCPAQELAYKVPLVSTQIHACYCTISTHKSCLIVAIWAQGAAAVRGDRVVGHRAHRRHHHPAPAAHRRRRRAPHAHSRSRRPRPRAQHPPLPRPLLRACPLTLICCEKCPYPSSSLLTDSTPLAGKVSTLAMAFTPGLCPC